MTDQRILKRIVKEQREKITETEKAVLIAFNAVTENVCFKCLSRTDNCRINRTCWPAKMFGEINDLIERVGSQSLCVDPTKEKEVKP